MVVILVPLSPDAAAEDLKVVQRLHKDYRSSLMARSLPVSSNSIQPRLGDGDPCLFVTKQSSDASSSADDDEAKPEHKGASNSSLEVEGMSRKREEGSKLTTIARIDPTTRAEFLDYVFSTTEQSMREGVSGGALQSTPTHSKETDTLHSALRTSQLDQFETITSIFQNQDRAPKPLVAHREEEKVSELVGVIERDSTQTAIVESSEKISGSYLNAKLKSGMIEQKTPKIENFGRKLEEKQKDSIRATGIDSIQLEAFKKFRVVRGWCRIQELSTKMPELQFPNFNFGSPDSGIATLASGQFKIPGGGKSVYSYWRRIAPLRRTRMLGDDPWNPYGPDGGHEFDQDSSEKKHPILEPSPENMDSPESAFFWPDSGKFQGLILGPILHTCFVGKVHWSPTIVLKLKSWRTQANLWAGAEFEVRNFLPKIVFEQATFDPVWNKFCKDFDKRKFQALRSKLFEEGEPDTILESIEFHPGLIVKEAKSNCKVKAENCPSQNPCSGYILWRHGSLNRLGGNSRLRVCFADKVVMFSMVCLVEPDDVIKVVFQGLKVATSKLENCQKMVKSGNCFVKPNLELNSRSMDMIRDQRLLQHETRNVYLPREGMG
ncbi:unnamed protein product [Linum trigynum]|uniref:Uncharacterized protein n=1 Tax=Linum trigynum TaxID=586398 RepID=A0AAV2E7K2_9ROSI